MRFRCHDITRNDPKSLVKEPTASVREHPPAATSATSRQAGALLIFMWGAYFLNYCDRQAIFAIFPVLRTDLGLTDTQLGLTGSIFLWVYGVGCPIAGQIADKLSKRLLVVFSLAIWSVVTVWTGFATSAFMLLSLRAAMGVSEALYMPAAISLTANAHPPALRSRAIATLSTAQIIGTVGGAWFGGWMAQQGQWRAAFFVLGAVGLLYAVPYFIFLRSVDENAQVETRKAGTTWAVSALVKVPTYLMLCVVFPLFLFGLWLIYSWLPNFLHEKFSLSLADAAFTATVYLQGATLAGMLSGGVLADWLYKQTTSARLWLLTASLVLCAPCLHTLGSSSTLIMTCLGAAGFGLFSGFFMGNIFPSAFEVVPADTRASAVGVLNFCGSLLSGFAPLVGGMWKQTIGMERLLTYTGFVYLIGAGLLIFGIKRLFPQDYAKVH
jgi:predicted MFS family arabinose efflux permease